MSKHFVHFPGTRLGRLTRAKTVKEILEHCDKYFPGKIPEYFFCHDWMGFNSILNVYRNGTLHITSGKWFIIYVHLKNKNQKIVDFFKASFNYGSFKNTHNVLPNRGKREWTYYVCSVLHSRLVYGLKKKSLV
jgi:hypothetical protein